jgi:hypothetical protein
MNTSISWGGMPSYLPVQSADSTARTIEHIAVVFCRATALEQCVFTQTMAWLLGDQQRRRLSLNALGVKAACIRVSICASEPGAAAGD